MAKGAFGKPKQNEFMGGKTLAQIGAQNEYRQRRIQEAEEAAERDYEAKKADRKNMEQVIRDTKSQLDRSGAAIIQNSVPLFQEIVKELKRIYKGTDIRWHHGDASFQLARTRKSNASVKS